MLAALQTEMTNLIETVAQLTEALMPRRRPGHQKPGDLCKHHGPATPAQTLILAAA